jgi:hypothetical protein
MAVIAKRVGLNAIANKRGVFVFSIVRVSVLSACGTLKIDTDPAASQIETKASATVMMQPTPTQTFDGIAVATATPANSKEVITPEVVAEATAEPLATVGYSNEETGISFSYPTNWFMEEEANAFVFRNRTMILRVGYRMPGEWLRCVGMP